MCFSMAWLQSLAIWAVIAIATYVILIQILLPYIMKKVAPSGEVGEGIGIVISILRVVFWAIVVCIVIYIAFSLIACLWSFAPSLGSLLPRGR